VQPIPAFKFSGLCNAAKIDTSFPARAEEQMQSCGHEKQYFPKKSPVSAELFFLESSVNPHWLKQVKPLLIKDIFTP
jgi:hypothetical protein